MRQTGNGSVGAIWGKVAFLVLYPVFIRENCCHSPGCMAMQPGEIYQAQAARFTGEFAAGFAGLTPHSRRTRPGRCGQELLC